MISNLLNKFGVRQRCIEGARPLTDLLLTDMHYEHDVNYYIYSGNLFFLGTLNRKLMLDANLSPEECREITCGELCERIQNCKSCDVVYYRETEPLGYVLHSAFKEKFPFSDELVLVETDTKRLIAIFNRKDFFHEIYSVNAESEGEFVCYREMSHHYAFPRDNLNKYARNINSQHGEDGILAAIFDKIGTTSKYAVEFGGWDGIYLSNIRDLIISRGFSGLFIEGEKERAENLLKNYADNPNVTCIAAYVGFRGENTLDRILKRANAPKKIDLISIDIDGYDYHVWDALSEYHPRVIIIEYNPTIPNDIFCVSPKTEDLFCGSSAAAMVELGRKKGYSLVAVTETNCIFVTEEEYDKLQIWDNDLDTLRKTTRLSDGRYFQTYDKRVMLTGFTTYIWEGTPFTNDDTFYFTGI